MEEMNPHSYSYQVSITKIQTVGIISALSVLSFNLDSAVPFPDIKVLYDKLAVYFPS